MDNITAAWAVDREFVIYKALLDANEKGGGVKSANGFTDKLTFTEVFYTGSGLRYGFYESKWLCWNSEADSPFDVVSSVNATSHAESTLGSPRRGSG